MSKNYIYDNIMNGKDWSWNKDVKEAFKFYDTIDFMPYLREGYSDGEKLIGAIEEAFDYTSEVKANPVLNGLIFNCVNSDEFFAYLQHRYDNKFSWYENEPIITYTVHYNPNAKDDDNGTD